MLLTGYDGKINVVSFVSFCCALYYYIYIFYYISFNIIKKRKHKAKIWKYKIKTDCWANANSVMNFSLVFFSFSMIFFNLICWFHCARKTDYNIYVVRLFFLWKLAEGNYEKLFVKYLIKYLRIGCWLLLNVFESVFFCISSSCGTIWKFMIHCDVRFKP